AHPRPHSFPTRRSSDLALRFGQLDAARKALESVPKENRESAPYHVVAGWLARAQGDEAGQERHFAAALAKEPGNETYQYNLAARSEEHTSELQSRVDLV